MPSSTIDEWCEANRICRSQYYNLKRQGLTPREMRFGRSVRISPEADAEWRRQREAETPRAEQTKYGAVSAPEQAGG
jgi:hypothetical protein